MADKNNIQEHLRKDPKEGQELADINVTQGMVKSSLDQQSANLQMARESAAFSERSNTELRSALEMASDTQQPQMQQSQQPLPPQASNLSPQTQEILSKYGVNPSITESRSSNSSSTRNGTTKTTYESGGRVTNTTTINNITNNDVKTETNIETPPAQVAPLPRFSPTPVQVSQANDSTPKFKAWLTGIFAKRDNENKIREREYKRKEYEISRTTDKLMRRMEDVSRKFAEKANPENIGRTFMSQLKLFLGLFVGYMLPKVWDPLMKGVSTIEANFNDLIGKGNGESFIGKLKSEVFGIKNGQNVTFTDAIKNAFSYVGDKITTGINDTIVPFFKNLGDVLISPLEKWFNSMMEDRKIAINAVNSSSDISWTDPKSIIKYLGDIIAAAFGGTGVVKNSIAKSEVSRVDNEVKSKFEDKTHNLLDKEGNIDIGKAAELHDHNSQSFSDRKEALNKALELYIADNEKKYYEGTEPEFYNSKVVGEKKVYDTRRAEKDLKSNHELYSKYVQKAHEKMGTPTYLDNILKEYGDSSSTETPSILNVLGKIGEYNKDKPITLNLSTLTSLGFPDLLLKNLAKNNKDITISGDKITFSKGSFGELAFLIGGNKNDFSSSYENLVGIEAMRQALLSVEDRGDPNIGAKIAGNIVKYAGTGLSIAGLLTSWMGSGLPAVLAGEGLNKLGDSFLNDIKKKGNSSLSLGVKESIEHLSKAGPTYELKDVANDINKGLSNFKGNNQKSSLPTSGKIYSGDITETAGIKNNNPGNLANYEAQKRGEFELDKFESLEDGYRKLFWQLDRYITGKTTGEKLDTLDKIFPVYAPKGHGDNDPDLYAKNVSEWTGIGRDQKIDPNDEGTMKNLVAAITRMEHGLKLNEMPSSYIDKGWSKFKGVEDDSNTDVQAISSGGKVAEETPDIEKQDDSEETHQVESTEVKESSKSSEIPDYLLRGADNVAEGAKSVGNLFVDSGKAALRAMLGHNTSEEETIIPEVTSVSEVTPSSSYLTTKSTNTSIPTAEKIEPKPIEKPELAEKPESAPVIFAPQTSNNGGNTNITNYIYKTSIDKTYESLLDRGGTT